MLVRSTSWLVLLSGLLGLLATAARADVRLPSVFGDHCVLQRDVPIRVWGWAEPAERVTVKLAGRSASATAGADGRWRVELPPRSAGGPHVLVVRGRNTLRVRDVLIGEVWLCSGQSNMAWTVRQSQDASREIGAARDDLIRHFHVPRKHSGRPLEDVEATWAVCSPDTAGAFTACGYFMARELRTALRVPVGLVNASWGGTRIEPWTPPDAFEAEPSLAGIARTVAEAAGRDSQNQQQPAVLYHGMVHALAGYSMRGAIWYQGESNRHDGSLYAAKMRALIRGWRRLWDLGDFPFHYVQIAPYAYGKDAPELLPAFWEAQASVLDDVPNTGMVVTNDVATIGNIHPPNKQEVGRRLALLALRRAYGKDVEDSGPTFRAMTIEDDALRVAFDHAQGGLRARDGKPLTHFEIAGAGTGFVAAEAQIDGATVVLRSPAVPAPLAMRFAWDKVAEPNLVNRAGLPAGAFRAGEIPRPDALAAVTEAGSYTLVYDLDLARASATPSYDVDASATAPAAYDRVAYLLELQTAGGECRYLWVSMDAFTDDPRLLGIPTAASGAHFQQAVRGLAFQSNDPALPGGTGLAGHLEFWSRNYGPANAAAVPGASAEIWDFGDEPSGAPDGYGSMQVHVPTRRQTLFAINRWKGGGSGCDLGIGNSALDPRTRDWTFARNGGTYTHKRLRVFVRPTPD